MFEYTDLNGHIGMIALGLVAYFQGHAGRTTIVLTNGMHVESSDAPTSLRASYLAATEDLLRRTSNLNGGTAL